MSRPLPSSSSFDEDLSNSIQYITDNILVTALPQRQTQVDNEEDEEESSFRRGEAPHASLNPFQTPRATTTKQQQQEDDYYFRQRVAYLDSFLQHQHCILGDNAQIVLVSLAADPPDPEVVRVFSHQVVTLPWQATGAPASELPTLECLLRLCYAVQALLSWAPTAHVRVVVACENGQTRTGLAVAALLRYLDHVPCTRDGFLHFVVRTMLQHQSPNPAPLPIYNSLPASVRTLLRNWDAVVEWQAWLQTKPLWLRAITIQGIPVDDQPCVDLYDATGRHVYSSHAWLWEESQHEQLTEDHGNQTPKRNVNTNDEYTAELDDDPSLANSHVSGLTGGSTWQPPHAPQTPLSPGRQKAQRHRQAAAASPWVDDEGFYKVNQWVAGDFCLLCRFGGAHAIAEHDMEPGDTAKLLFRYANATTVLPGGTLECRMPQVDIMDRYEPFLDPQDFLLTLVFESSWEQRTSDLSSRVDWTPPPLVFGHEAVSEGCSILADFHVLQPTHGPLESPMGCPPNIWSLLWQLSGGNEGITLERWQGLVRRYEAEEALRARPLSSSRKGHTATDHKHTEAVMEMLNGIEFEERNDETRENSTTQEDKAHATTIMNDSPPLHDDHSHQYTRPSLLQWRSAILQANAGDVPVALGLRGHAYDWVHTVQHSESLPSATEQPRVPLLPLRQTEKLPPLAPLDDPTNAAAVDLYLKIAHAGVALEDLQDLAETEMDVMPVSEAKDEKEEEVPPLAAVEQSNPNEASYHEEEKKVEGTDESTTEPEGAEGSNPATEEPIHDNGSKHPNPPMKLDERFKKYWKMKSVGLPDGAIKQAMQKDSVDVSIWDFDWEKNYEEQVARQSPDTPEEGKLPMKKDPRFEKYWKMKSVGLPEGAVKQAMQKDSVDVKVWDLDWEQNYEEQTRAGSNDCSSTNQLPMKADPRFEKYWKMKAVGLPDGAVLNAMSRDDVDPSILQLDWERHYEEQTAPAQVEMKALPMKSDPRFEKYWKMKSVGLPDGAIRNAMARDHVDATVLNLDWEKTYEEQTSPSGGSVDGPPMKEDPRFSKYWKMKSVGLPEGAILNAMARDKIDGSVLNLDWEKNYEAQTSTSDDAGESAPMKEDPKFKKYWKMKTVGLPDGAIRNAMTKDGLDPSLLDLDWGKSLASQEGVPATPKNGPMLRDDPEFTKYFRMLSMGLPPGAVKNAMTKDGKDPGVIDLDPNRSLASQVKGPTPRAQRPGSIVPKKRVRRKKIFWKPLDPEQIKENTLWSLVKGKVSMSHLNYDVKEFEDLFTESADPADKKKKKKTKESSAPAKKAVQVIDGKRSMNGGIILLRLKMGYDKIAELVDAMEQGRLDATQMMALKEFLPTAEEASGLEAYMSRCKTEEEKTKAYADFSECEKYMWTIRRVENARSKFECMLFKAQFRTRVEEVVASMKVIEQACDEVKTSESLHKVLAMILSLVNTINTGESHGQGVAQGFNLDALLKLNEAKAFDKRTSVLQYLVKLVKQNDEGLLDFHKEIKHVNEAQNLMMDMLASDIKKLAEDLEAIRETVTETAECAEATGDRKVTLEDLKEQKTLVRKSGSVVQFNKVDHLTGRTPMERFFLKASNEVNALLALADEIRAKYESLLEFFGEAPEMPSNEFFGTMFRFIKEFNVSEKQVEKEERARQKEKRRSDAKAKAAADKARSMGESGQSTKHEGNATPSKHGIPKGMQLKDSPEMTKWGTTASTKTDPSSSRTGIGEDNKAKSPSNAHPLAAMLAARQSTNGGDAADSKAKEEKMSSAAHPLAAMLEARQKPEKNDSVLQPSQSDTPSSSAHPLAAMLAARQIPTSSPPDGSGETEDDEESHALALPSAVSEKKDVAADETALELDVAAASEPPTTVSDPADDTDPSTEINLSTLCAEDDASQSTMEEASALAAEENARSNIASSTAPDSTLMQGNGFVQHSPPSVKYDDSAVDVPDPDSCTTQLEASGSAESTGASELPNVEKTRHEEWLTASLNATGWNSRRATPKPASSIRVRSDESSPWVSRRESMESKHNKEASSNEDISDSNGQVDGDTQ